MNRVIVKFLPKVEGKTFDLQLNKKMSYDQVSKHNGKYFMAVICQLTGK